MLPHAAKSVLIVFYTIVAFVLTAERASACICGFGPTEKNIPEVDTVFVGRIVWFPKSLTTADSATFRVDRVFKGDVPRYAEIGSRTMCGDPIGWWGGRYIVFANYSTDGPRRLEVLPCLGTAPLDERTERIIAHLGSGHAPPFSPIDPLLVGAIIAGGGLFVARRRRAPRQAHAVA